MRCTPGSPSAPLRCVRTRKSARVAQQSGGDPMRLFVDSLDLSQRGGAAAQQDGAHNVVVQLYRQALDIEHLVENLVVILEEEARCNAGRRRRHVCASFCSIVVHLLAGNVTPPFSRERNPGGHVPRKQLYM
eukprot:1982159-Prymnesium_polylepis.1